MKITLLAAATLLTLPLSAAEITKEALREALTTHKDVLIDVLRQERKLVLEIVSQAAQEDQQRRQQEAQAQEQRDFEESFKKPLAPAIDGKTRIRGNKKAKYTLVEYSDFQCPYCARGYQTVEQLREKYGNDLRFVFKHLPLANIHPQAIPSATWMEAVALQSPEKAWTFHDRMFQNQQKLGEAFYKETAQSLGLDLARLEADVKKPELQAKIKADMDEAEKFGFSGTPGYLLNGIPVRGAYPVERFDEIIKKLEKK